MDTSLFDDPEFREVFRSLDAKIYVARTEPDPAHPSHPIIHFYGEMQDPSTSMMTGHVKMTPDNQIQWHFVGYHLKGAKRFILINTSYFCKDIWRSGECHLEVRIYFGNPNHWFLNSLHLVPQAFKLVVYDLLLESLGLGLLFFMKMRILSVSTSPCLPLLLY